MKNEEIEKAVASCFELDEVGRNDDAYLPENFRERAAEAARALVLRAYEEAALVAEAQASDSEDDASWVRESLTAAKIRALKESLESVNVWASF